MFGERRETPRTGAFTTPGRRGKAVLDRVPRRSQPRPDLAAIGYRAGTAIVSESVERKSQPGTPVKL